MEKVSLFKRFALPLARVERALLVIEKPRSQRGND